MRRIKIFIYNRFKNTFLSVSSYLLKMNAKMNLEKVREIENVYIHQSLLYGDHLSITIEGKIDKLEIKSSVVCQRFCNFLIFQNASLIINENVFFNNNCSINCLGLIEIGENTIFGEGVRIYDHNHLFVKDNNMLSVQRTKFNIGSVKIGKNCWIGSNVTILNNVEIGNNVIVGANCLIHKSIPSNSIVQHKEELIYKS